MKGIAAALSAPLVATLLVVLAPWSPDAGSVEPAALWSSSFSPGQKAADCGKFKLDANAFCVANEARNGLELGVKFQTDRELVVTGVRVYRVDPDTVTGSLWGSDGTLLATGTFPASAGGAWQDLVFADPVTIEPGATYIASYFTPQTKYAFDYRYFAASGLTVGPVTALQSVDGNPNGVFCYHDSACAAFPVHGHQSSTYWVTPVWRLPGTDPTSGPDQTPPRITARKPSKRASHLGVGQPVKAIFSEQVDPSTINKRTIRLVRNGRSVAVPTTLTYDATRRRLVMQPRSDLRHRTTYRVVITTQVLDTAGNHFDQDPATPGPQRASWTFRTR